MHFTTLYASLFHISHATFKITNECHEKLTLSCHFIFQFNIRTSFAPKTLPNNTVFRWNEYERHSLTRARPLQPAMFVHDTSMVVSGFQNESTKSIESTNVYGGPVMTCNSPMENNNFPIKYTNSPFDKSIKSTNICGAL